MNPPRITRIVILALAVALVGCATTPGSTARDYSLEREAVAGTGAHAPVAPAAGPLRGEGAAEARPGGADVRLGSGQFVNPQAARPRRAVEAAGGGQVVFNFENQPIQAVVKAVLGDLLKVNYSIAPGVQGSVTFATAQPIGGDEVLPVLEMLLSWTDNALVRQDGRYVVLPLKQATTGYLIPGLGAAAPADGFAARLYPLRYISATEMQKLLKPFARPEAFLLVDAARNLLVMAGTPAELASYQRSVQIFDVDWLRGMSVGVYSLQHAQVGDLMPELEKMFGPKGDTPLAGMLRFIPIERTNAIVVISPQPAYLEEMREWIARIDNGGGNDAQLYVYDVKNVKATDLAGYLNSIYNGAAPPQHETTAGRVGPGLQATSMEGGTDSQKQGMGAIGQQTTLRQRSTAAAPATPAAAAATTGDSGMSFTAVDENNQLLVRCRPGQWSDIQAAIRRLDNVPLQVQIETRILEVQLTGEFRFGVQWYLGGLVGNTDQSGNAPPNGNQYGRRHSGAAGLGGTKYNSAADALFYSFISKDVQGVLRALESTGNTKVLSAPSLVVLNNQEATIQVGDRIPITQTFITSTTVGTTNASGATTVPAQGEVQYLDTGVILDVVPRVNPGGLVYLDIQQQVSTPGTPNLQGNPPISQRAISTQVAVQSGETVLLGGLIQQNELVNDNGLPWVSRVPVVGRLFGTTDRTRNRTELIVLITPRVITNSAEARQVTDEYQRKFESLAPLRTEMERLRPSAPPPAAPSAAGPQDGGP
ncbi:MAG: type II secretion system secretin GspD [Mizugakiibacter sp.]|uniref:type II secretion system secretin GspD n=1 Tax=Mizugakiibacter sp. TaxID=1972610 RepID=UPI0031C2506A|nr:type II secretion system secretin GspD [Xanthomonadaceae bacterium]